MAGSQHLLLQVKTGIKLEVEVFHNPASQSQLGVLLFHPWSWLGGCMYDYVVDSLWGHAISSNVFKTVLRYNVRGTGASSGFKSFSSSTDAKGFLSDSLMFAGCGSRQRQTDFVAFEWTDAEGLVDYLLSLPDHPPSKILLLAYSYGSCVAAHLLDTFPQQTVGYISVGFPLGWLSKVFLQSHSSWHALTAHHDIPKLFVMGTEDQFSAVSHLEKMVSELQSASRRATAISTAPAATGTLQYGTSYLAEAEGHMGTSHTRSQNQNTQLQESDLQASVSAAREDTPTSNVLEATIMQSDTGQSNITDNHPGQRPHVVADVHIMEGCDHFFHRRVGEMCRHVLTWIGRHCLTASPTPQMPFNLRT